MIHRLARSPEIYLSTEPVDMRKSINGLTAIVQASFELDPYQSALFVFCNRRHDKIKILQWDKNGFVLYYKRMERDRFRWPARFDTEKRTITVSYTDLKRLLEGLSMEQFIPHKNYVSY